MSLLKCPFCGAHANHVKHEAGIQCTRAYDQWYGVSCAGCNAGIGYSDRRFRTKEEATAAWNRRQGGSK